MLGRYTGLEGHTVRLRRQVADLVLLDANPLTDIRNTQRIFAVVLNGRVIEGKEREALLAEGKRLASGKP